MIEAEVITESGFMVLIHELEGTSEIVHWYIVDVDDFHFTYKALAAVFLGETCKQHSILVFQCFWIIFRWNGGCLQTLFSTLQLQLALNCYPSDSIARALGIYGSKPNQVRGQSPRLLYM